MTILAGVPDDGDGADALEGASSSRVDVLECTWAVRRLAAFEFCRHVGTFGRAWCAALTTSLKAFEALFQLH